ncbi:Dam family site-specific DNA-(adenine-N6)-methyltransferase [Cutibacterium sp.]|uniref:Dam family site-specific DNA-(adenine-N6)-methyltransferase n=1 Tax=Cutibacterium sp. TaxID=1912221 RepID=UPI0026DAD337|nr:Dam family site-specific DNA-(adenine-N6)-methyltransferase [Cutibacterium sp.]MDO4413301.1 Dam family site-specific DNA-(adenine-N6)-methyltransferase [Cutibacterium sp.]
MKTAAGTQNPSAESEFINVLRRDGDPLAHELGTQVLTNLENKLIRNGVRVSQINNRRYLGGKHKLTGFIRKIVDQHCPGVTSVIDIFSGTGTVANAFKDKTIITNDILYSNYITNVCWFSPTPYRPYVIIDAISSLNAIQTSENNYVRKNFSDTYFSADNCSKIGAARELIKEAQTSNLVNNREFAILVTSVLYGMDRIANTVGHYDAFRKGALFDKSLIFPVILPSIDLSPRNKQYNTDANGLIDSLNGDLLYCDPPYNSRQYSDAYHLLENIARWEKPEVYGVARKMDRTALKSDYNTVRATAALRDLVRKADAKYIVFSYNNMATKGNGRSNAKISDDEIMDIFSEKGHVQVFEQPYRAFSTGKSAIAHNAERLFVCTVKPATQPAVPVTLSPINYIGGKGKLMPQLSHLLPSTSLFIDLFAGGCTVGANIDADKVIFNDSNEQLMDLIRFLAHNDPTDTIHAVDSIKDHYGFSDTYRNSYKYYGVDSSSGLADINRDSFMRLRDDYNAMPIHRRDPLLLYILVIHGFNNQLRFNAKGNFNLPVGKRDFNSRMRAKLKNFHTRISKTDAVFQVGDFRDFNIDDTPKDAMFYCDPPYLITQATYNERGGWSENDERDLITFLGRVHDSGRRFALSNVIQAKGSVNHILSDWANNPEFTTHKLTMSYRNSNYHRANRTSPTLEVLVTNF